MSPRRVDADLDDLFGPGDGRDCDPEWQSVRDMHDLPDIGDYQEDPWPTI